MLLTMTIVSEPPLGGNREIYWVNLGFTKRVRKVLTLLCAVDLVKKLPGGARSVG